MNLNCDNISWVEKEQKETQENPQSLCVCYLSSQSYVEEVVIPSKGITGDLHYIFWNPVLEVAI